MSDTAEEASQHSTRDQVNRNICIIARHNATELGK
jgi:hypothetical protein